MAARPPAGPTPVRSAQAVRWKYFIFWLLFFGLIYLVSLFGIVAEA